MEDGVSGVLCGLGGTMEFCYSGKDIIIRVPSLDDVGCPFEIIGSYPIFYLVLFSPILYHNTALRILFRSHVDT